MRLPLDTDLNKASAAWVVFGATLSAQCACFEHAVTGIAPACTCNGQIHSKEQGSAARLLGALEIYAARLRGL